MEIDISRGIEVGSFHYKIVVNKETDKDLEGRVRFGEHHNVSRELRIASNHSPQQFTNTFLHETMEAINEIYCNGNLKHDHITNIANGISQVMKSLDIDFTYKE